MSAREYEVEFHLRVRIDAHGAFEAWKVASDKIAELAGKVPELFYPVVEQGYHPSRVHETLASRRRRADEAVNDERTG